MRFFTMTFIFAVPLFVASLLVVPEVHAIDMKSREELVIDKMSNELSRLRRDMSILQKEFYAGEGNSIMKRLPVGTNSSQAEVRLTEMEEQIRDVNGRMEEVQHQISQVQTQLAQYAKDLEFRLSKLEQVPTYVDSGMMRTYAQPDAKKLSEDPNAPVDLLNPVNQKNAVEVKEEDKEQADTQAFKEAKEFLAQAQYDKALGAFRGFIATYPDSALLPEAHYWAGEVYNIRTDYEKAAIAFLKSYQADEKGTKAGESLVRLGGVLGNMDKKKEACTTLDKAAKEFASDAGLKKQIDKEKKRVAC